MSKSPLSGAFAGSSEPAKNNKKNGALLLISGIALATSIGGVFAANSIELNGNEAIEFGQGLAAVDPCADSAEVSMDQFISGGEFYVGTVTVTFASGCDGKDATVTLLNTSGAAITNATFTAEIASNAVSDTFILADNIVANTVDEVAVTTAD